jgi:proline iminopeptidase
LQKEGLIGLGWTFMQVPYIAHQLNFSTMIPRIRQYPVCKHFFMTIRYFIITILLFVAPDLAAQKVDSIKYDNGFLYYNDYGQGEPIILLSGGPGNDCSQFAEMANVLAKNYRVILFEQRGTGRSIAIPQDSTTINLSTAVSDLKLLFDKLKLNKAIICGHAWGAALAMYFATAYPVKVKSLILIEPGVLTIGKEITDDFYNNRAARWSISEKKLIDSLTDKLDSKTITDNELHILKYTKRLPYVSKKERLDSIFSKIDAPVNVYMQTQIFKDAAKSKIDLSNSLKNFTKPVSIICGSQDFMSYISYELKMYYPEFKLYWIQDSGHFPMYEQPKQFYSVFSKIMDNLK